MIGCFWDLLIICTVTTVILGLMLEGLVPLRLGVLALLALVCFRAMARALGGAVSRQIRRVFTVGLPVLGVFLLAVRYGFGDPRYTMAALVYVLLLVLVLFGVYIMFRGLFVSR